MILNDLILCDEETHREQIIILKNSRYYIP